MELKLKCQIVNVSLKSNPGTVKITLETDLDKISLDKLKLLLNRAILVQLCDYQSELPVEVIGEL